MSKRYCPQCEQELNIQTAPMLPVTGLCANCGWSGGIEDFQSEFKPNEAGPKTDWTPYVSIDLETTGLDENECQVLEFGAVIDDWHSPVEELPRFQRDIMPCEGYISGQPYALWLNAAILKRLANNGGLEEERLGVEFAQWLEENGVDPKHVQAAGKNFASFDMQFLKRVPYLFDHVHFKHRAIDPAMFYWRPDIDDCLPSTQVCLQRAGFSDRVAHTAVEDCITVIQLIRRGVRKCQLCVSPRTGK
jgi:hypothetical protein